MANRGYPDWRTYITFGMKCVYCDFDGKEHINNWRQLAIDHLIPKTSDGENDVEINKVVSCTRCNSLKGYIDIGDGCTHPKDINHRDKLIENAREYVQGRITAIDKVEDYECMLQEIKGNSR